MKGPLFMFTIEKYNANPTLDFAAEELKKYLRMMMPRCGEIPIHLNLEKITDDTHSEFKLGLMDTFGLDISDAEVVELDDIVYIDANEKGGIIAGSNPTALLIAVYRYLRFCGCRWLFPGIDGERIPMIQSLPEVKYRKKADYRYRGQCNEGAESQQCMMETIDFTPKIGMNTYMLEFDNPATYYVSYYEHSQNPLREPEPVTNDTVLQWKRQCEVEIQKRGLHFHDMGHGWTAEPLGICSVGGWKSEDEDIVPEESVQYLAQINGERKLFKGVPLNTNVCMSNPEARAKIASYVADYAEKQNNVDFLHIWLADATGNHCECENCTQKDTSDWYIILLNEIDAELTRRNLKSHLVFIVYTDTLWAPQHETLKNTERFTMLFAPISRIYTQTYTMDADTEHLTPYGRNHCEYPKRMQDCLGYLSKWHEQWKGDSFVYEYHFWIHQYCDPSGLVHARYLHDDIVGLKKHRLMGSVEDGSQRSFFPTGFSYYVYGETLFDSSVSYDELLEDYFSHAFGEEWKQVVSYLQELSRYLDFEYFSRLKGLNGTEFYNPEYADKAARVRPLTDAFSGVIAKNRIQPYRASTVSWQLLEIHREYVNLLSDVIQCKAVGDDAGANQALETLRNVMGAKEIYIERYYDQHMAFHSLKRFYTE